MKMMFKFLIILATLLLVTGAAFAAGPSCDNAYDCECYEVTATDLDNAGDSWTRVVERYVLISKINVDG